MRWRYPEEHSIRVRRVFLWLPHYLHGEWRWLERAEIVERWWQVGWVDLCWGDDPDREKLMQPFVNYAARKP